MKRTMRLLSFVIVVSMMSCKDAGTLVREMPRPIIDCGDFELFRPEERAGDYYYITGVRVFPIDKKVENGSTNYFYCNTLREQLAFSIHTEYKRLRKDELREFPGIKGDPIVGEIVNPMKWEHASVRFDKPVHFRGQEIPAGTSLLDRIAIEAPSFYFPLTISPFVWDEIHMSRANFSLKNDDYRLLLNWETLDNKTIRDTVDVTIFFD